MAPQSCPALVQLSAQVRRQRESPRGSDARSERAGTEHALAPASFQSFQFSKRQFYTPRDARWQPSLGTARRLSAKPPAGSTGHRSVARHPRGHAPVSARAPAPDPRLT